MKKNKGQVEVAILTVGVIVSVIYFFIKLAGYTTFTPYTTEKFPPTENVQIYNEAPTTPYIEIGEIKASVRPTDKQTLNNIMRKAKEVGADGVIIKQRTKEEILAIAIKFRK